MNDFRKVQPGKSVVQAQGTAFAATGNTGGGKTSKGRLSNEEWWKLTPKARKKIDDKRKADKEAKEASNKKKTKSKPKVEDDDDNKSVKLLQKKLSETKMQLSA